MAWHPFRNPGLKALALLLGASLWFITSGERTAERSMRVPLEFQNRPDALELTGSPPETVQVHLRGPSGVLGRLQPGDVRARVDLSSATPGTRVVNLTVDDVTAPFGVEVTAVATPRVSFELERSATAIVPVVPTVEGEPADGLARASMTVDPAKVTIVGPESHVKEIAAVMTEPVSIAGTKTTVRERVSIAVGDAAVRLADPQDARVTIEIVQAVDRVMPGQSVVVRDVASGLQATVTPAAVTSVLRGAPAVLARVHDADLAPYVDVRGFGPGEYALPVRVDRPDAVSVTIQPTTVRVVIR